MNFLKNKTILVTGGTGTFGSEVTKFILNNIKIKKLLSFQETKISNMKCQKNYHVKGILDFL